MLKINMRSVKGIISSYTVDTKTDQTTTIKIPHHGAVNVELLDSTTGHAPQMVMTKRVGNNLLIVIGGDNFAHPDIVLEDYYDNNNVHLIGLGENGQYYEYVPTSGDVAEYPPALAEGHSGEQVLGGEGFAGADPLAAGDNNFGWLPFLLLGGAAAAGGIAIAASHGGGGGDHHAAAGKTISITMNPVTDADNNGRPEISGTSNSPDSQVVIHFPDGSEITAKTDSQGNWSAEAPASEPNGTITVTVTDSAGNSGSMDKDYIDTVPPESAIVNVNDNEQIAGKAEPGSTVIITDGDTGETITVDVDENGDWSIQPNPVNEGDSDVSVVVVDPAGNLSPPTDASRPDTTAPDNINSGIIKDSITLTDDVGAITGEIADGSVTDDARPTFSGKATADIDHVNIYDNGKLIDSVPVDADGNWSWTPAQDMADNSAHELTVAAVDAAGNEGPQTGGTADGGWSFTVDTSAPDNQTSGIVADSISLTDDVGPVTGEIADGSVTDDARPTFSGKATADIDHVNIYDNGELAGTAPVDADGNWSWTPAQDLADGSVHELTVAAVDAAGNEGPAVSGTADDGWSFTIDTSAPDNQTSGIVADSITLTDDVGAITGEIADGSVTDDARPTFSGKATADIDHVNIYDNGKLIDSVPVDADGNWSWTPAQDLADGSAHDLSAAAVDVAGNEGAKTDGWSFTVDTSTVAPEITVNTEEELAGNAEPGAVIVITDPADGSKTETVADADGHWSIKPNPAGVGDNDVVVEATDEAGNSSTIIIDGPADSTPPDNQTSGIVADSISLTDDVGPVTGEIADGSVTDDARPTFSGKATADIDHVNIYDNGELAGTAPVDADGNWSWTPAQDLADGSVHELTVTAVDAAGNEGPAASGTADGGWSFTVDTSVPDNQTSGIIVDDISLTDDVGPVTGEIADGGVTDDTRPTFSGSATADIDHVNIYDNGELAGSAVVDADGKWSWTPEQDLADGSVHELTVAAVDAAGNEGPQVSGTADDGWSFTVDTSAPDNQTSGIVTDSITLTDDVGPVQGVIADGSVTDDARPTYAGTATQDIDHVNIYDDGTLIGSAAVDADGNWSWTPESALASGAHALTVAAVDAAGNEGPQVSGTADAAWDFSVLTSAPAQPSIENVVDDYSQGEDADTGFLQKGQSTNDSTLTVNGNAGAGLTVVVWATDAAGNKVSVGEGVADSEGRWSITTSALGEDGSYSLTATAVNAAGVSSAETGAFNVVLDTLVPEAAEATLMDAQGEVQGEVADGGVTDDRSPVLKGTAEAGATVAVYLDGSSTAVGSTVAGADGSWTLALGTLADGEHSWQVKVTDAAGNETRGESSAFTLDSSSVALTIDQANDNVGSVTGAVLNGGLTDDSTPELQGTAQAGAVVTIRDAAGEVLGSSTADSSGIWRFAVAELADGEHSFTAEVTNAAGNRSEATFTLTVDATAPILPVITGMTDDVGTVQDTLTVSGGVTDDPAPTFTGTAEAGSLVTLYDGDTTVLGSVRADAAGSWSYTPTTNLVDGEHSISVTSTDAAGNVSAPSADWSFTLDTSTIAPEITTNTEDELAGNAEPGAVIVITDPADGSKTETVADADGHWSIQPNPVDVGAEDVVVEATDEAGNSNSIVIDGPADSTPPDNQTSGIVVDSITLTDDVGAVTGEIADGSVTDDTRPVYAGKATADIDHVNIYDNGELAGTAPVDADGNWSWTPAQDLTDGSVHELTVAAVDAAGNEGPQVSGTADDGWSFTIDTSTPDNQTSGIVADSITLTDDIGAITGKIADGGVTDDARPTFSGKATADIDHVNIYDNGELAGTAPVDADGNWSWTPAQDLADGSVHELTVAAVDAAGNEGPKVSGTADAGWSFTIDTSTNAPAITVNTEDELAGNAEPGAVIVITDPADGSKTETVADADGHWSIQPNPVDVGAEDVVVEAIDEAGNSNSIVIDGPADSTPPDNQTSGIVVDSITLTDDVGAVTGEIADGSVTDDTRPVYAGKATADIDHVNIYDNGELAGTAPVDADGNWSWTPAQDLADGSVHELTVAAVDAAGNEGPQVSGTADDGWSFTIDTSIPDNQTSGIVVDSITLTDDVGAVTGEIADGSVTDDTRPVYAGKATADIDHVNIYDNGELAGTAPVDADGNWSWTPAQDLADGSVHELTVAAVDAAGNEGPQVSGTADDGWSFTIDTSVPDNQTSGIVVDSITLTDDVGAVIGEIADGSVTDDTRPVYAGKATADIDHVNIYDNGELAGTAPVDADGNWSWTPAQDLADGSVHELTVAAVDAAGNEGPQVSGTADDGWSFTIDTSAPGDNAFTEGSISLTDDVGPVQGIIADGATTDDARPTYSGSVSAEGLTDGVVSVNIYDAGQLVGSAAVDADGNWSWTPESAVTSGAHALTVAAVDAAGNEGPQVSGTADGAWDFSVLTSAPGQPAIENVVDDYSQGEDADTGFLQKGQSTNDSTPTVNGTAGAGLTVVVWATDAEGNRVNVGEGVADSEGRWSITTTALGADGSYSLTATAVNAAGVSSAETGAFNVVLDTAAPAAAEASLMDAQGEVQGTVADGGVTDDRSPVLKGTAEAGATVAVYLDGSSTAVGSTVAGADGSWTLALGTLADGEHSWQVKVTDAAGNETRGESSAFTLDSSSVALTIDQANDDVGSVTGAVLNGGLTDDSTPELQGTALAGAVVTIRDAAGVVLGSSTADSSGAWRFAVAELADGEHSFTAEVINAAGNSSEATFTLTVDTTPPEPVIIQSLEDDVGTIQFTSPVAGNVTDDPAPTFTGTAEAGSLVTLYDNGLLLATITADVEGNWSYTPTTNLLEGTHSITATATDAAGNVSEISNSWNFILDITAPNVGISGNAEESLSGVTEPGVEIVVIDNNGTEYRTVADQQGKWIIAPNPIAAGESGEIYAIDPAGNQGEPVAFQGSALASYDLLNESAQVNTTTAGDQLNPATTRLADGRIVVVWQGTDISGTSAMGTEVYMQLYEADGLHKIGTEQQVNQRTANNQDSAQV
ncbi:Ig-like domain-containing protein, partial [Erwinia sp. P6884]|uniref:Ig-like domain-containing protein n=1 Tax=Erwinia sp. P6884 TaxID=3141450 RepID=UPI00318FC0E6